MKVWRVENDAGIGPYNSTPGYGPVYDTAISKEMQFSGTQPGACADFSYQALRSMRTSAKLFGFHTLRAAVRWFGARQIRELRKYGFHLKQVPAENVVISKSGRQCMFHAPEEHPYHTSAHYAAKRTGMGSQHETNRSRKVHGCQRAGRAGVRVRQVREALEAAQNARVPQGSA